MAFILLMHPLTRLEKFFVAVLILVTPFLFIPVNFALPPTISQTFFNLGHAPFFAIVSYVLAERLTLTPLLRTLRLDNQFFNADLFKWAVIGAAILVGGTAVEFLQARMYRNASWSDVGWNMVGFVVAFAWLHKANLVVWCLRMLAIAIYSVQISWFLLAVINYWHVLEQFPLIADFENPRDIQRWRGAIEQSSEFASLGEFSMKAQLKPDGYSEMSLHTFAPNWSDYQELVFDVYNPSESTIRLSVRIHDRLHRRSRWHYMDRFNKPHDLQPGWNTVVIDLKEVEEAPEKRSMAMSKIESLMLFTHDLGRSMPIYIDNMRLR